MDSGLQEKRVWKDTSAVTHINSYYTTVIGVVCGCLIKNSLPTIRFSGIVDLSKCSNQGGIEMKCIINGSNIIPIFNKFEHIRKVYSRIDCSWYGCALKQGINSIRVQVRDSSIGNRGYYCKALAIIQSGATLEVIWPDIFLKYDAHKLEEGRGSR